MAVNPNKQIQDIIDAIEVHVNSFIKKLPKAQTALFEEIVSISKDFIVPAKTVKEQAGNLRLLSKIDTKIKEILITPEYQNSVDDYIDAFEDISKMQNKYFSSIATGFKTNQLLNEIKKQATQSAIERLTGDEIHGKVGSGITDILRRNINTAKSYKTILSEVNKYLNGSENRDGVFKKNFKALVNDSINMFAREYTKAVTDDLGLKWYVYAGSLKTTSRPFCKALIGASYDCMPYIHESQLNEISKGHICGNVVPLDGLYETTNGSNIVADAGGYNCAHQFYPVSEFVVPKELRDKFK